MGGFTIVPPDASQQATPPKSGVFTIAPPPSVGKPAAPAQTTPVPGQTVTQGGTPGPVQSQAQPTAPVQAPLVTPPLKPINQRVEAGIKQGWQEMITGPASGAFHGLTDPPRDSTEQTLLKVGIPLPVYRLGKMAVADTKETYKYATEDAPQQAAKYIAEGKYPEAAAIMASVPMAGVGKILGPRVAELESGVRSGGDLATPLSKDVTEALITAVLEKLPEAAEVAGKDLPKAIGAKEKVVAASNDVLKKTAQAKSSEIADAVKAKRASNGVLEQKIAGADRALTQATQKPTVTVFDLGNKIAKDVADVSKNNTSPPELPQLKQIVKQIQAKGQSLSYEDLKDLGGQVQGALKDARGKDSVVLAKLQKFIAEQKSARATQLGMKPEYDTYTQGTKELTEHGKGIVKELAGAKSGLDWYRVIAKPSNQPMLDALTKTLGLPKDYFKSIVDSHAAIAKYAAKADSGGTGSRFAAVMDHPAVAGGAMAGTAGAGALMQMPLSVRFVMSLFGASKAAEFMDRLQAVTGMRKLGLQGLKAVGSLPPQQQSGAPGTPPASVPPPQGVPPVPQGPVTPGGAPVNPVVARIQALLDPNASFKTAVAKGETDIADMKAERDARLEKIAPTLKQGSDLVDPTTFDKGYKTETKGGEASGKENVKEGPSESKEGQNVPKEKGQKVSQAAKAPKPYEKFGVVVDKTKWTTPEEVAKGKADAKLALQDGVNKRASEIREGIKNGTIDKASATKQVQELVADQKKAVASIDKIKTPEVGRAARDRIRKGGEAFDALADVGKQQAEREQLSGEVQADIDAGIDIERLDKLLRDAGFGSLVDKITKAHTEKYDTEYPLLAKQLQAAYDAVSKKK